MTGAQLERGRGTLDPGIRAEGQLREVAEATHGFGNLKPVLTPPLELRFG